MINQYIKDSKGHKCGVLVAAKNQFTGDITIGWSLCNKRDEFNKDRGQFIALGRARKNRSTIYGDEMIVTSFLPDLVKKNILNGFADRTIRYFHMDEGQDIRVA